MTAAAYLPDRLSLPALREAATVCHGCDLWRTATQVVFGEGRKAADVMFVGEQPGDQEDQQGKPFVGPAGRLLDKALEEAGIDRTHVYVTNAVKHFKWQPRGKRRIHQKPNWAEMTACKPWLEAELAVVQPRVLVALGATAAQVLLGKQFRVTKQRGEPVDSSLAEHVTATIHPSAILRAEDRDAEYAGFLADIRKVAALL
ncbi:MAG TPA: UdgX family uracil-DNA binding protein [Gaiellaceae bacterium]|nr:UdgX family uracil-DNA binding protein [Gaiellaceae bacterium]